MPLDESRVQTPNLCKHPRILFKLRWFVTLRILGRSLGLNTAAVGPGAVRRESQSIYYTIKGKLKRESRKPKTNYFTVMLVAICCFIENTKMTPGSLHTFGYESFAERQTHGIHKQTSSNKKSCLKIKGSFVKKRINSCWTDSPIHWTSHVCYSICTLT